MILNIPKEVHKKLIAVLAEAKIIPGEAKDFWGTIELELAKGEVKFVHATEDRKVEIAA
jgi:hypothetical protein